MAAPMATRAMCWAGSSDPMSTRTARVATANGSSTAGRPDARWTVPGAATATATGRDRNCRGLRLTVVGLNDHRQGRRGVGCKRHGFDERGESRSSGRLGSRGRRCGPGPAGRRMGRRAGIGGNGEQVGGSIEGIRNVRSCHQCYQFVEHGWYRMCVSQVSAYRGRPACQRHSKSFIRQPATPRHTKARRNVAIEVPP